jgi:hypothetical protein
MRIKNGKGQLSPVINIRTGIINIIRGLYIDQVQGNSPGGRIEGARSLYRPRIAAPGNILQWYGQLFIAGYISGNVHRSDVAHTFNHHLRVIRGCNIINFTRVGRVVNRPATGGNIKNPQECIAGNGITGFALIIGIAVTFSVNTYAVLASHTQAICNAAGMRTKQEKRQINNTGNAYKVSSNGIQSIFFTAKLSHLPHPRKQICYRL